MCACTSKLEQVIIERSKHHASGELTRIGEEIMTVSSSSSAVNRVITGPYQSDSSGGGEVESTDIDISEIRETSEDPYSMGTGSSIYSRLGTGDGFDGEDPLGTAGSDPDLSGGSGYTRGDHGPSESGLSGGSSDNQVRIPAEYVTSRVAMEKEAADAGIALTFDADGSAVYTIAGEDQRSAAKKLYASQIDQALKSIVESGRYRNVSEVTATNGYTKFTIVLKDNQLDPNMNVLASSLYELGMGYVKARDAVVPSIKIEYKNARTGEVIDSIKKTEA